MPRVSKYAVRDRADAHFVLRPVALRSPDDVDLRGEAGVERMVRAERGAA